MTRELLAIDPVRGRDCLAKWQNMIDTTHRQKKTEFASVDEYAEFLEGQADQLSSSSGGDNGHPASIPLLINLITLLMRWRDVDVATAKKLAQGEEVCPEVELYLRSLRCVLAISCGARAVRDITERRGMTRMPGWSSS